MLFVLFQLGSDRYALPAREVIEVLPLVTLKSVPGAPRGIVGLMDYRGAVVPVVDLSALALGVPAVRRVSTRLLVVRYTDGRGVERVLALKAERATETLRKEESEFKPSGVSGGETKYLGPVATDARGLIQRVNVNGLLSDDVRARLFSEEAGAVR